MPGNGPGYRSTSTSDERTDVRSVRIEAGQNTLAVMQRNGFAAISLATYDWVSERGGGRLETICPKSVVGMEDRTQPARVYPAGQRRIVTVRAGGNQLAALFASRCRVGGDSAPACTTLVDEIPRFPDEQ